MRVGSSTVTHYLPNSTENANSVVQKIKMRNNAWLVSVSVVQYISASVVEHEDSFRLWADCDGANNAQWRVALTGTAIMIRHHLTKPFTRIFPASRRFLGICTADNFWSHLVGLLFTTCATSILSELVLLKNHPEGADEKKIKSLIVMPGIIE